jgi:hypothetical protein
MARQAGVGRAGREPEVPGCHAPGAQMAAAETYIPDEGVGCEACHGAGSDYAPEAIMRDKQSGHGGGPADADARRLQPLPRERPRQAVRRARRRTPRLPTRRRRRNRMQQPRYLNPLRLAERPGAGELFITFEAARIGRRGRHRERARRSPRSRGHRADGHCLQPRRPVRVCHQSRGRHGLRDQRRGAQGDWHGEDRRRAAWPADRQGRRCCTSPTRCRATCTSTARRLGAGAGAFGEPRPVVDGALAGRAVAAGQQHVLALRGLPQATGGRSDDDRHGASDRWTTAGSHRAPI